MYDQGKDAHLVNIGDNFFLSIVCLSLSKKTTRSDHRFLLSSDWKLQQRLETGQKISEHL